MAVYVDDMNAGFGRMKMSHMIADTTDELVAMADRIGVARKWIQKAGTPGEHFDIALSKKQLAIAAGAIPVTWLQLSLMSIARQIDAKHAGATLPRLRWPAPTRDDIRAARARGSAA